MVSALAKGWLSFSAFVLSLSFLLSSVMAQENSIDQGYPTDPVLQYRPSFARSLPVQILLTGIVLTLVTVLLLHLIFTAQYHWPLARTNYILQLTGVITLLISLIATIYVVLSTTIQQSQHWPYMLSYLAVDMPRTVLNATTNSSDPTQAYLHVWTVSETATWVVMNATTSVVVQLMSSTGPLAIISAVMQLLPIFGGSNMLGLAADTRNVCNATLSVLFTSALVIWGFLVNRRQAWRTDGGTAVFGAGAILLALISTTLNFYYIPRQDQYPWMPKLMWAITLWQSFLGWWWWVGAGMGVSEVEDLLRRENKRQQKRQLRAQRRKERGERAKSVWKGVTGAFKPSARSDGLGDASSGGSQERTEEVSRTRSQDASSIRPPSSTTGSLSSTAVPQPAHIFQRWYARLRHDHLAAAHIQAVERVERIQQVYGREGARNSLREPGSQVVGWGLGSYGLREDEEGGGGSSLWWWGPLRRWRLKDSTTYR
ncbi:hypothetical protein BU15DRAFT_86594 [Melanogaster broomeanus]|nr:hypothetical protein BU15DRAFT_86594 [Melanogaster broomeanus]